MGSGGAPIRRRLIAIAVFMGLWSLAIGFRLFDLQIAQSADFRDRAERQQQRVLETSPRRGPIYDRNGNELAVSIEVDSLYAVPSEIQDPVGTADFLSRVLEIPTAVLSDRLDSDKSFRWIERKISARQAEHIRSANIDGLYFQTESKRFYPNRDLAAHVLGFVNLDDNGGSGLEYRFEDAIGGTPGRVIVMKDARGRSFERLQQPPAIGASLTTTIDRTIQYIVEQEITRTIAETGAAAMSVVVTNPLTGEVLAMANYPQFNPNEYSRYPAEFWKNRSITDVYEPGSTFKIVTAAAALEENLTYLDEIIDCQMGSIVLFGHRINDHKPFGELTVREILQYSSDVGIIKLGLRLGDERFASYIDRLGFGRRTGIDLPGEALGLTKPSREWSNVSVGAISMGQEIATTPLQIVNLVAAVANEGILYQPYVVDRIEDANGIIEQTVPSGTRVMLPETARLLQESLEAVVSDGTGTRAQIAGFSSAGKTGTAQKVDPETGTYSLTKHVASFAGYAPADSPALAAIVMIDEPSGPDGGGEVAAPVFARIVERVLRNRSVRPDRPSTLPRFTEDEQAPDSPGLEQAPRFADSLLAEWEVMDTSLTDDSMLSAGNPGGEYSSVRIPVPDFSGKSVRQVSEQSLRLGLRPRAIGSGVAVLQAPAPGTPVAPGTRVEVWFSTTRGNGRGPGPLDW